ncbi:MAG: hypothetical protein LIP23_07040 [Planctomycetes bacterium]|nr:hypothetical protein [Planctomycetota bacterium]
MTAISGANFSQLNPAAFRASTYRAQFATLPDMSTGLNPKGSTARSGIASRIC